MLFTSDRTALRRAFADAWRRRAEGRPLEPLEARLVDVVAAHPEYQSVLAHPEALARDYGPGDGGTNPFLHMAMHVALAEQRESDRPPGVRRALHRLARRLGDEHAAQHAAMECLGEVLWRAQRDGAMPDEQRYLDCLRDRAARGR